MESGEKPAELLNQVLLPAINQVGEFFDQGKFFLPQLIASAEAMKNSIEVLEPLLQTGGTGEEMPVVVIATVEGDIHDIGKNLVALMLKNHGSMGSIWARMCRRRKFWSRRKNIMRNLLPCQH